MPLGWHYCCLFRGTTVAPFVLLLMPPRGSEGEAVVVDLVWALGIFFVSLPRFA